MESGLLTLVLRGKDTIFGAPGAAGFALEIEDLVSLHIVGDGPYAAVTAALSAAGGGFQARGRGEGEANGRASVKTASCELSVGRGVHFRISR